MPDSPAYLFRRSALLVIVEIVKVKRVDKILENVQPFIGRVDICSLAVHFLLRRIRRLFHDRLFHEDWDMNAHCQGDGIARTRIDLKPPPVLAQHDLGEKDITVQFVDDNVYDFSTQLRDCAFEQIVSQGPRDFNFLQFNRYRIGFAWANPDREVTVTCHVLEQHDPMLRHQADPNTINRDFNHNYCPLQPNSRGETPLGSDLLLSIADSTLQTNVQGAV